MNKTLKKTFFTICLAVMLFFYVIPAHANVLTDIYEGAKKFIGGLVCDYWAPRAADDVEIYVDQYAPGAGGYMKDTVLYGASLLCGGKEDPFISSTYIPMFDYKQLVNDIRDIFREELQNAFNNYSVQDAYGTILGANETFYKTFYGDNSYELYAQALEEACSNFNDALGDLESLVDNQNLKTKSIVLGPYIAGISGLITYYQKAFWLLASRNPNEGILWFDAGRKPIQIKIDERLKPWILETWDYLRSYSSIVFTTKCVDKCKWVKVPCDSYAGGLCYDCVYEECKGDNYCLTAYYYDTNDNHIRLGSACYKENDYIAYKQAEDTVNAMIDDYIMEMCPTLILAEVAIAEWEQTMKGDWMFPKLNWPLLTYPNLPLSIPIINISSGVNYTTEQISQKMRLASGWSMISLPVIPENPTLSILFPDAVVVYGYEQGKGYIRINGNEKLEVGKAYWILLNKGHTFTLTGQPIKEFALPIQNGWYMVGSCSSSARAITRHGKINVMYNYSPGAGYKRVPESGDLQSGQGYWVNIRDVVYGYSFSQWLPFEYNWHDTLTLIK